MADKILECLSASVLEVGELLDDVFDTYPDFDTFVEEYLPLRPHTAERVRAMYLVHRDKNGHTDLPAPWKALWSLD